MKKKLSTRIIDKFDNFAHKATVFAAVLPRFQLHF